MKKIIEIIADSVDNVEQGNATAIEVLYDINKTMEELKLAKAQIEEIAFDEFDRNKEGKEATIGNLIVSFRNGGFSWKFDNVEEYAILKAKQKSLEGKYKSLFEHSNCIDVDTGEVLDIKRTPRKDSLIIKSK